MTGNSPVPKILVTACLIMAAGCSANETVLRSGKASPTAPAGTSTPATVDSDLTDFRTAGFEWIYVIRRLDGQELSPDDRTTIRAATADANRRVVSENGRAVIVGSNYQTTPASIGPLRQRFNVTDIAVPTPSPTPSTSEGQHG